ncbi:uncharacterized protein LOC135692740 [Rhopilema esculentum]|uniref:uncharacterized protein LOC135692740 n=1 Tax=Rhopilema esculentum TaxID=499914 RepID=UPI0031D29C9D|eukprot:gene2152-17740_t
MDAALFKVEFSEAFESLKTAISNADKKVLAIVGCAVGSYAAYQALEYLSMSGKSNNTLLIQMHDKVRGFYNSGYLMKLRHFYYDPSAFVVNYGSYGVLPKPVLEFKRKLQVEMELCPDEWFFLKLREKWDKSCQELADAVGCNVHNIAYVHNVTDAINSVIRSTPLGFTDAVLITNHTYGAIKNTVDYYTSKGGARIVVLDIPFPIKDEESICDLYRKIINKNPDIKLAIIDHITSSSALIMPIKKLVKICKKHGILTLIDGAHAPGQLALEIEKIDADFYAGNLHKWHYAPRGCGFIWAKTEFLSTLDPSLVSHNYNKGFQDKFYKQGTDDYTNYLAGGYAVSQYYPSIGGLEHLYQTMVPMRQWAAQHFRKMWGTESPTIPSTMQAPYMEIVKMPEAIISYYGVTPQGAEECKVTLMKEYNVYMMVSAVNDALWCRVSCQIFSTKKEYYRAAQAVMDLESIITGKVN